MSDKVHKQLQLLRFSPRQSPGPSCVQRRLRLELNCVDNLSLCVDTFCCGWKVSRSVSFRAAQFAMKSTWVSVCPPSPLSRKNVFKSSSRRSAHQFHRDLNSKDLSEIFDVLAVRLDLTRHSQEETTLFGRPRTDAIATTTWKPKKFLEAAGAICPGIICECFRTRFFDDGSSGLSSTIGWKPAVVTAAEVTEQAKALCGRYLRAKLRSCGPMHKKLGLQRLKSVSNMCSGYPTTDVSTKLRLICQELERTHPETFQTVVGNIGVHSLPSDSAVQTIFQCVARELFRNDISWGRIAALYSLSGGLAIDCVKLGHPEYIMTIVNSLALFVERDLAQWIAQQGGWGSLITRFKSESSRSRLLEVGLLCVIVILVLIAVRHVILR